MESPDHKAQFLSRSAIMRYAVISAINLVILLVGVVLGVILAPHIEGSASASSAQAAQSPVCVSSATVECVIPLMTVGSGAIGKLLSNQISSDQLTVNGYDILKLDNNLLNALISGKVITTAQGQTIAETARPDKILRFQPRPQPPSPPAK
jgi:hypothetical protein